MIVCGLDRFLDEENYHRDRIGLLSNQTGITQSGAPNWAALLGAGYRLSALFGPEHGFGGSLQDGLTAEDSTLHGIPVYSLYGEKRRPDREQLDGLDLFLIDIQDVGCRSYTYLYTVAYCIEACAEVGIPVVVLDRPAPLGSPVEGNPVEPRWSSFVGDYGLPNRTGVTVGEYAAYVARRYVSRADVSVIPVEGWDKADGLFAECSLARGASFPWVSPSPNIPTLRTALCYPGMVLIEGCNISEGRGTTRPFEMFGAPWIDEYELASALTKLDLPGTLPVPVSFIPMFSKYAGEVCHGVQLHITNRHAFASLLTGISVIHAVRGLYPRKFSWRQGGVIDRLAGGPVFREAVDAEKAPEEIYTFMTGNEDEFRNNVESSLIYR